MHKSFAVVLFSALLVTAGTALMQSAIGRAGPEERAFSRPTERVDARLAYIKAALKITDAQQPQWQAFADAMRKSAAEREQKMKERHEKMMQWRKQMAQGKPQHEHLRPTLVERLDRAQKRHADAIERLNARAAVVKPLYASLSPEQQKVADVVLAPRHHGGDGRGGNHGAPWGRG